MLSDFVLRKVVEIGVAVCLSGLALFASGRAVDSDLQLLEPTNEKPTWSADLHALGFARDQEPGFTFFGYPRQYSVSSFDVRSLGFSSKGIVAVAFATHEVKGSKGERVPGSGHLHVASFDSSTGHLIAAKDLPTQYGYFPLASTARGNFIVKDDYRVILYSPDLKTLRELDTRSFRPGDDGILLTSLSEDGRYIVVYTQVDPKAPSLIRLLDSDTLQEARSTTAAEPGTLVVSGNRVAMWNEKKDLYKRSLFVSLDGKWKEIYRDTGCGTPYHFAQFLTENDFVVLSCNALTVMDVDGKISFRNEFPANRPVEMHFAASADGARFGIAVGESKGVEVRALDLGRYEIPWRLLVYNRKMGAPLSSFSLNGKPNSFALSRDGHDLALFRSGVLDVFRLPNP